MTNKPKKVESRLLPCPCGGEAEQRADGFTGCKECSFRAGTCIEWNTRAEPKAGFLIEKGWLM